MARGQLVEPPEVWNQYKGPLFCTWKKHGDLRGCIGTFDQDSKFGDTLKQYSLLAAVRDSRFPPIKIGELPKLRCEISVLSNFTCIDDPLNWEIGRHGIEIAFKEGKKVYRSTFLPHVAEEFGWNQQTTLENMVKKAGYTGSFSSINFTEIKTYESIKFGMDWDETPFAK